MASYSEAVKHKASQLSLSFIISQFISLSSSRVHIDSEPDHQTTAMDDSLVNENNHLGSFFINGRGNPVAPIQFHGIPIVLEKNYELWTIMHRGVSKVVFSGFNSITDQEVTITKYENLFENEHNGLREIQIGCGMKHQNLVEVESVAIPVRSRASSEDDKIQTDLVILKSLHQVINVNENQTVDSKNVMHQVLKALSYMHSSSNVVHRDIKPLNVLVSPDREQIKLRGYSRCRVIGELAYGSDKPDLEDKAWVCSADTRRLLSYTPPELLLGCLEYESQPSIDMWSIGCLFADILYKEKSFLLLGKDIEYPTPEKQLELLLLELEPSVNDFLFIRNDVHRTEIRRQRNSLLGQETDAGSSAENEPLNAAASLLDQLLAFDPTKRLTVDQALEHAYFYSEAEKDKDAKEADDFYTEEAYGEGLEEEPDYFYTEEEDCDDIGVKGLIWKAMLVFYDGK